MNRVGGKWVLWLIVLGMLLFTATRTLHFLQATFPPGQGYVAFIALAGFDLGILAWFYYATSSARGAKQRALAYGMIFVCAAGVIFTTIADMLTVAGANGVTKVPPDIGTIGLWGCMGVIVLNVLAGILVHLLDPAHLQHMREEEIHDKIIDATHIEIEKRAGQIAPMVAERVAQHWEDKIVLELVGKLPQATNEAQRLLGSTRVIPQTDEYGATNGNGNGKKKGV